MPEYTIQRKIVANSEFEAIEKFAENPADAQVVSIELTLEELKKIDTIHNAAFAAVATVLNHIDIEWNMEWISELSENIAGICVSHFGKSWMDVYPFADRKVERND